MNIPVSVHNEFKFTLCRKDGSKVEAYAFNTVLDQYYTRVAQGIDLTNIHVGSGTTPPEPTDTALETYIDGIKQSSSEEVLNGLPDYTSARKRTFFFNESRAIGSIAEVGLAAGTARDAFLSTRALLEDAEGHSLVINKTASDTLYITATVYLTVRDTSSLKFIRQSYRSMDGTPFYSSANPAQMNYTVYSHAVDILIGEINWAYIQGGELEYSFVTNPILPDWNSPSSSGAVHMNTPRTSNSYAGQTPLGGYRYASSRILAGEQNAAGTGQIKSLCWCSNWGGFPLMFMQLPNHDIFPPMSFDFELVGDGTTTDFNLGIPELMQGSGNVSVTVDGVTLTYGVDYQWGGRDFTLAQAWISQDTRYLDKNKPQFSLSHEYRGNKPLLPVADSLNEHAGWCIVYAEHGLTYDFEQPVPVSAWINSASIDSRTWTLYYSSDGVTWSIADQVTASTWDRTFSTITARYWQLKPSSDIGARSDKRLGDMLLSSFMFLGFGHRTPQISFTTAPAVDAVIQITAKSEYPIKNNKWILDSTVVDFNFVKDNS